MYCIAIFFFVIDTTLASDKHLRFRKNLLERIQKLIMSINDNIRYEKLQYDINKNTSKISALSSGQIGKFEYLTGEDMLRFDQSKMIESATTFFKIF